MVLSCVLYSVIDNYVCIDYICSNSKKLSLVYPDKTSEEARYNGLIVYWYSRSVKEPCILPWIDE